jgi:hypothetical protein
MKRDWSPQGIADKYITRDGKPPGKEKPPAADGMVDRHFVAVLTALTRHARLNKFQRDVMKQALMVIRATKDVL